MVLPWAGPYRSRMVIAPTVGPLLKTWRARRHRSQLDLATEVGVSTRHLSFVETGRSRPSPELLLMIADHLEVPLRERNSLLLAAGYAPRYGERPLDDPEAAPAVAAVERLLDAHDPYPGVAVDRRWAIVRANEAAFELTGLVGAAALEPGLNVYRLSLHPDGLVARSPNAEEWVPPLMNQLRRSVLATGDPALSDLLAEVAGYPTVAALEADGVTDGESPAVLIPFRIVTDRGPLSLFTTITTFGTATDVTFAELSVELFFPADEATDRLLRD